MHHYRHICQEGKLEFMPIVSRLGAHSNWGTMTGMESARPASSSIALAWTAALTALAGEALLCVLHGMTGGRSPQPGSPDAAALLAGVSVPLALPQMGRTLRRAMRGEAAEPTDMADSGAPSAEPVMGAGSDPALVETHAAVCRELHDLREAYAELQNDAAQRTAAAVRLDYLAHHDALTNLPNRVLLMDRLNQGLTFAKRAGTGVLVIYMDLDRFKAINDTLGHAAGDRVLVEVAGRIAGCMRGADTASRVGGDEFVLVCATPNGIDDAPQVAARVLAAIAAPIDVFGVPVTLGASMGISLSPVDGTDAEELIAKADAAMFCAKERGRNCFNLYTPEIQAGIESKLKLEAELRQAIAHDQFEVHYQPIVDLDSGRVSGAEALVRWRHPARGLVPPGEFVPFAQEHGLGAAIDRCVLRAACRQLNRFALTGDVEFSISVNVSADALHAPGFVAWLTQTIAEHGVEPRRIAIELTQETLAKPVCSAGVLRALQQLGVRVSIDDFGTGPGSLGQMRYLQADTLKIDGSFVRGIVGNAGDEAVARTIVTLAHSLGMKVGAEGVETAEQAHKLRALGSDSVQGFLVSAPLAGEDFERFACSSGTLTLDA